jgi:hypothetical protein
MANDIAMLSILNSIKKISKPTQTNNMIFGEVKKVDPLEIDIGNNIVLSGKFLYLGQMCRPHKVKIPHTHILDTHFTEMSPSIGNVGAGLIAGTAYEQTQSALAETTMNTYKTLDDEGNEVTNQISDKNLGRGGIETSIAVTGQATIVDDSVMITDNKHKHIIPKQITKDVHFPKSDYEESVTIEIEPKLAVGDIVLMFAMNNNQCYYVAERVEAEG